MFGTKLNPNTLRQIVSNTKSHIGTAYGNVKSFMGNVDRTISTMKDIYAIAQPVIKDVLGSKASEISNKYVKKGLTNYENIRNRVMDTDENLKKHYNTIVSGLDKKNIDLGL